MKQTLHAPQTFYSRLPKISILWGILPTIAFLIVLIWQPDFNFHSASATKETAAAVSSPSPGDEAPEFSYIDPVKADYRPFMDAIRGNTKKMVESEIKKGDATAISVYFESLPSGTIYSYNNNSWYSPASLLKVTVLMAYLKKSESDPTLLDKKVVYHKTKMAFTQNFLNDSLTDGETYTNRQLLEHLIISSENDAANLLVANFNPNDILTVFKDFNIETDPPKTVKDYMRIGQYMQLLRTLYKATYLNKKNSEYALKLLTRSDFKTGIRAGIPSGVQVASKFGERGGGLTSLQLHDCGIVYYGNQPYLLGVMTKGQSFEGMQKAIQAVSAEIFDVVSKNAVTAEAE